MKPVRKPRRWKWFRRAVGTVVGLLLGWVVAGVVHGDPKPIAPEPAATEPATTQSAPPATTTTAASPTPDHIPVVILPSTAPATQPLDPDDNLNSIIPAPGQTGWLWPVCAGIVALFALAAGVGIVSKSLRIKDPGDDSQTKHH